MTDLNTPGASEPATFVEPAQQHSAGTIAWVVVACALVFGGFYLMGLAFSVPGWEVWLFCGGIMIDAFGLWLALGWLPGRSQR